MKPTKREILQVANEIEKAGSTTQWLIDKGAMRHEGAGYTATGTYRHYNELAKLADKILYARACERKELEKLAELEA